MNDFIRNANLHAKNVAWSNLFGAASLVGGAGLLLINP
jgi:hypothetical protein